MNALLSLSRLVDRLTERIGRGVSWLSLVMVLLGAFNALARWLGRFTGRDLASNAYLEGQWYLFSLLFLLGAAWTLREDRHVRVSTCSTADSPSRGQGLARPGRQVCSSSLPFCAFALAVLSFPSVRNSIATWEVSPDPGGLPRWPLEGDAPGLLSGIAWRCKACLGGHQARGLTLRAGGHARTAATGPPERGGHEGWAEGA